MRKRKSIRMNNSIVKLINRQDLYDFIDNYIDQINYKINNSDYRKIKNSTIDFITNDKINSFILKLLVNNICKTKPEVIRLLAFNYLVSDKSNIKYDTISIKSYLQNKNKGVKK